MTQKISCFCDGLIEAAWIAAAIIAPLFFNIYSFRIFEPDKITILRCLAVLILSAWVIKLVVLAVQPPNPKQTQEPSPGLRTGDLSKKLIKFLKMPIIVPLLFLGIATLLATIFSVTPAVSLWGSYQRLQGSITFLSYIVIFAALLGNLRQRAQVERLFTVIILTSLPVSLYGILQHYGLDPIPWGMDVSLRVSANLGNAIFLAAYLVMVLPLTAARLLDSFQKIRESRADLFHQICRALLYFLILCAQLIAIYLTGSRGPFLGLLAAGFFMILLIAIWRRKRWLVYSLMAAVIFLVVFVTVLSVEDGPFETLRASPNLDRIGILLDPESSTALGRKFIWAGAAHMVLSHSPLQFPNGAVDRWNFLRPLLGYGPESMFAAYNQFYNPALASVEERNATPDRSHNETWDSLVTEGVLGLAAYLVLFSCLFYYALKWMGLLRLRSIDPLPSRRYLFWSFYLLGGLSGGIFLSIWRGIEYVGIGLPFGIVLGLSGYLILTDVQISRCKLEPEKPSAITTVRFMVLLVLFVAILAHFIEINFGIAISVTRSYFWIYAALLVLVGEILPRTGAYQDSSPEYPSLPEMHQRWYLEPAFSSVILGITLITLGFDFLTNQQGAQTILPMIWLALTRLPTGIASWGVLGMVVLTWLAGSALLTLETRVNEKYQISDSRSLFYPRTWPHFLIIAAASLTLAAGFWFWQTWQLAAIARQTPASYIDLLSQAVKLAGLYRGYLIFLLGLLIAIALLYLQSIPGPFNNHRLTPKAIFVILSSGIALLILGSLVIPASLRSIKADVVFKFAQAFDKPGTYPVAIRLYQRANQLAPDEDNYYLYLAKAYFDDAGSLQNKTEQDALLMTAVKDLETAQGISPLNTDHTANLARLYTLWAVNSLERASFEQKIKLSESYYSTALKLSPNNVRLWNESAYLAYRLQKKPEKALELLKQALAVDSSYDWTYGQLGDIRAWQAEQSSDPNEKQTLFEQAVAYYRQSQSLSGELQQKYNVNISLGEVLARLGRNTEAIDEYETALKSPFSARSSWRIQETLARLYSLDGDQTRALDYAAAAYSTAAQTAAAEDQARLKALIDQIQSLSP